MYFAAYIAAIPLAEFINDPERRFVADALNDVNPFAPFDAVMSPMIVNVPVEELVAPAANAPAVTFPVIEITPLVALLTATPPLPLTVAEVIMIVPPALF